MTETDVAEASRDASADFDAVYDAHILGRTFVENREYYAQSRERFRRAFLHLSRLGLRPGDSLLDIGGGQLGILAAKLLGVDAAVGDIADRGQDDVAAAGLSFSLVDLMRDDQPVERRFDCVVLQEVIEHLPQPPYVVFGRVMKLIRPGGALFLTTPNGHRFRNVIYMLLGREILDKYRYPDGVEGLGHQHEYTLPQMRWQLERAGLKPVFVEHYEDGWRGATRATRLARTLVSPVGALAPHLKNGLVAAARTPAA